jgi:hypothetical protein
MIYRTAVSQRLRNTVVDEHRPVETARQGGKRKANARRMANTPARSNAKTQRSRERLTDKRQCREVDAKRTYNRPMRSNAGKQKPEERITDQ